MYMRDLIKETDLSLRQLSELTKVNRGVLKALQLGTEREYYKATRERLCKYFNVKQEDVEEFKESRRLELKKKIEDKKKREYIRIEGKKPLSSGVINSSYAKAIQARKEKNERDTEARIKAREELENSMSKKICRNETCKLNKDGLCQSFPINSGRAECASYNSSPVRVRKYRGIIINIASTREYIRKGQA